MYQTFNFVRQTLTTSYTAGSGTLSVPNGAAFGTPTPSNPVLLTAYDSATPEVPLFNITVTGRSGNSLSVSSVTWGVDTSLQAGDIVAISPAAELFSEIQSTLMPVGGTTGQVLAKNSATDYDTEWVAQSVSGVIPIASGGTGGSTAAEARTNLAVVPGTHVQAWDSALDSIAGLPLDKGNLIAATGTVWDRIPAGADGQILMANSASPVGLQWNDGGSFSLYFSQTGGTSVTNTITETTLFSATAVGSRTVPAAKLVIGDVYRVRAAGFFNSPASTPGNATHRLRINGTQVLSTGAQAIPTSAANNMFTIECSILIRTLGGSGTVGANLVVALAATSTSLQPRLWSTSGPVTIDMSSSVTFDLTVEMSSALTTNLWQGAQGTVERVRVTALP